MQTIDDIKNAIVKLSPEERDRLLFSLLDLITNPDSICATIPQLGDAINLFHESKSTDHERFKRWVDCSHSIVKFNLDIDIYIQELGRVDSKLVVIDKKQIDLCAGQTEHNVNDYLAYNNAIFLSRLWVFGGYELVRTLSGAAYNKLWSKDELAKINEVRRKFARIRIPLAKYEPEGLKSRNPRKCKYSGDYDIAQNVIIRNQGIGWLINESKWISRGELADELLMLLEGLQQTRKHNP